MKIMEAFDGIAFLVSLLVTVFYFIRTIWQRNTEKKRDTIHVVIPVVYVLLYLCRKEAFTMYDEGKPFNFFYFELVPIMLTMLLKYIRNGYVYVVVLIVTIFAIVPVAFVLVFHGVYVISSLARHL